MAKKNDASLTYREAILMVLKELDHPIPFDELVERVLVLHPSTAKDPAKVVRDAMWELSGVAFIWLDSKKTVAPLHVAMPGVRFRWTLTREEIKHAALFVFLALSGYLSGVGRRMEECVEFEDERGRTIPMRLRPVKVRVVAPPFGATTEVVPGLDLRAWMKRHRARRDDHILFTIMEWRDDYRRFRMEYESQSQARRKNQIIKEQDQRLADTLFQLLESSRDERLFSREAIPTAHVLLDGPRDYPGHHWKVVIEQDPRMREDFGDIVYAERRTFLDNLLGRPPSPSIKPPDPKEKNRVYRFKAYLRYRKGLWRRIEVRGDQSMEEFDRELRLAFDHDTWDHLSGFWKRIRRGNTKRFREVEIGTIYPDSPNEEKAINQIQVGQLGLQPGDALLYVYDFGDWIEHILELEAIEPVEKGATYPRVIERSRTRKRR